MSAPTGQLPRDTSGLPAATTSEIVELSPATGFRLDHSLVQLPVFGSDSRVEHRRGVTAVSGLYFLGLPWLDTRGSALLGWVKSDAEYIAEQARTAKGVADARAATEFELRVGQGAVHEPTSGAPPAA